MENSDQQDSAKAAKQVARNVGGLLFVGCMFLGMAGGFYFDKIVIGLFAGMGLGFLLMGVTIMSANNKNRL